MTSQELRRGRGGGRKVPVYNSYKVMWIVLQFCGCAGVVSGFQSLLASKKGFPLWCSLQGPHYSCTCMPPGASPSGIVVVFVVSI